VTAPQGIQALVDQEVVALARSGSEAAYRELLRRYERPIFSLIFRMVRDRELSEDLSQETFVKALNALDSYRPEFKFSSWIFKIANNTAIGGVNSTRSRSRGHLMRRRRRPSRPPPCRSEPARKRRLRPSKPRN
jgi:RNA polymerase sigma factor (sigma-70 family)